MKYLFLIFFHFMIQSLEFVLAKDNKYKQLKEIEKNLLNNKELYAKVNS